MYLLQSKRSEMTQELSCNNLGRPVYLMWISKELKKIYHSKVYELKIGH